MLFHEIRAFTKPSQQHFLCTVHLSCHLFNTTNLTFELTITMCTEYNKLRISAPSYAKLALSLQLSVMPSCLLCHSVTPDICYTTQLP